VVDQVGVRDRMIRVAVDMFRERGVAGTALSDIVERSDAPRGSIYHHFPGGKAQLAEEAITLAGREMAAMFGGLVASEGPIAAVAATVAYYKDLLLSSEDFNAHCPTAAGAMSGTDAPGARKAAGDTYTSWEATLAAALWQSGLSSDRATRMATLAISAIEGAILVSTAQRDVRPLDRVAEELADYVHAVMVESGTPR